MPMIVLPREEAKCDKDPTLFKSVRANASGEFKARTASLSNLLEFDPGATKAKAELNVR